MFTYNSGNGSDDTNRFIRKLSAAVKAINPNFKLSIALIPEKAAKTTYYGQNTLKLGKYLDILIPMLYKENYNQNTA